MLEATFWIVAALLAQAPGTADYHGAYDPAGEAVYSRAPTAFLVESVRGVKPGAALDVGMGAGRNALYLAGLGWDVTGFDIAKAGVRQARERARQLGVRLNAVVAGKPTSISGRTAGTLLC
jgi:SAM-dependent methyltransferase